MSWPTLHDRLFCYASARRLMTPYLDGELGANERARMAQHMEKCQPCRELSRQLVFAKRAVKQVRIPQPELPAFPPWLSSDFGVLARHSSPRLRRMWIPITAAVAVLAAVVFGIRMIRRSTPPRRSDRLEVLRLSGRPRIDGRAMERSGGLQKGDLLETDGDSTALIDFGRLGQIEAESGTMLELAETSSTEQRLSLSRGKIYASINAPPRVFVVNTPAATAVDMGCAYSLEVKESGESLLEVTSGWVALNLGQREELVPAGTSCRARTGKGPGTPYSRAASQVFRAALDRVDFEDGGPTAIKILLENARSQDGITLWYLLRKANGETRGEIFNRLAQLVPPPDGAAREDPSALNEKLMRDWRERIDYASLGIDPRGVQFETGSVRPTGSLNEERFGHTATLLQNGKVLVAGGQSQTQQPLATAELYDPASGTFAFTGGMAGKRVGHTATLLHDGRVLVTGGSDTGPFEGAVASAELYDPDKGVFSPVGNMRYPRSSHCATLLDDGRVLITGGIIVDRTDDPPAEIYDPSTGLFTAVGKLNYPRFDHTATLLKNGQVLVAGGAQVIGQRIEVTEKAEVYDPSTRSFRWTGPMQTARHKHSAVALPNGLVLIMGGTDIRLWDGTMASAELYDPRTETFTRTGRMATARYKIRDAVVLLGNGRILVAGGSERLEIYDPTSGIFTPVKDSLAAPRYMSTATLLPDGSVVIIGGYSSATEEHGIRILPDAGAWLYLPAPGPQVPP